MTHSSKFSGFLFRLLICLVALLGWQAGYSQNNVLTYYINQAKLHSPLLKSFDHGIQQNQLDSLLISSNLKPQVNFDAAFSYAPLIGGIGYDTVITNFGNYSAMMQVDQKMFQKNISATQFSAIDISNQSLNNQKQITAAELQNSITALFLAAWKAQINWQSAMDQNQLLDLQKQILKPLVEAAIYTQADYLKLVIETQQKQIEADQLKQEYRNALYQLNYASGVNDTDMVMLQKPVLAESKPITSSIYKQQFFLDSLNLKNSAKQINQSYLPAFSWFANAGLNSSTVFNAYQHVGFSAGITLHVPVYDGNQKSLKLQKIQIDQLQQNQLKDQMLSQFDIKQNWIDQSVAQNNLLIDQYTDQKQNVEQLINFYKQQLPSGNVRISDLLDAYTQLNEINIQLTNIQVDNLNLLNDKNLLNQ